MASAGDVLQALARDVNCLADESRVTRRRGLQNVTRALLEASPPIAPDVIACAWDSAVRVPTLRLLSDPTEKVREMAATLTAGILDAVPDVGPSLPALVPTISARVGSAPFAEGCEEVRLQLLDIATAAVRKEGGGANLVPHLKALTDVCASLATDAFPDVKRGVCALATALCATDAAAMRAHAPGLAKALAANLTHQHSRVRSVTLDAVCELLLCDDAAFPELADRFAALSDDKSPAVREQCVRAAADLLVRFPEPSAHYARLLPCILTALSDEVESSRDAAMTALARAGERAAPGAEADRPGVGYVAPLASAGGAAEFPPPFDGPPPWGAVQLVQREVGVILLPAIAGVKDWTAAGRLRGARVLLGALWLARGTATWHADALLGTLYAFADDDDAAVRQQVAACARMAGAVCDPDVVIPLAVGHCAAAEGASLAHRAARVLTLSHLITGAGANAVGPHVPSLASTVCQPQFCATPVGGSTGGGGNAGDEDANARARLQLRLVAVIESLLSAVGPLCAREPHAYQLYVALTQLAAAPTRAGDDYGAQRRAVEAMATALAPVCGVRSAEQLHARYGRQLVGELVAGAPLGLGPTTGEAPAVGAEGAAGAAVGAVPASPPLVVELGSGGGRGGATAPNGVAKRDDEASESGAWAVWTVSTHEWHVFQAVLQHSPGAVAAEQLTTVFPVLAALLDPSKEPPLRLTALALVTRLLGDPDFCRHADFRDWAPLVATALLVPNLVWRAGRAAQQVRLAAALSLRALLSIDVEPAPLTAQDLRDAMPTALPVLRSALDDDCAETRLCMCTVLTTALPAFGPVLTDEDVRALYPDLLKRLDDASDDVRLAICPAIEALLRAANYDAHYRKPGTNMDETNLGYLVKGVLVHLDDFSPDIQAAAAAVVRAAMAVAPAKVCEEVEAVRDRHRSPKLCDALLAEARTAVEI